MNIENQYNYNLEWRNFFCVLGAIGQIDASKIKLIQNIWSQIDIENYKF